MGSKEDDHTYVEDEKWQCLCNYHGFPDFAAELTTLERTSKHCLWNISEPSQTDVTSVEKLWSENSQICSSKL